MKTTTKLPVFILSSFLYLKSVFLLLKIGESRWDILKNKYKYKLVFCLILFRDPRVRFYLVVYYELVKPMSIASPQCGGRGQAKHMRGTARP
jgi:hypothetical protein